MHFHDPIASLEDQTRRLALQDEPNKGNSTPNEVPFFRPMSQIELIQLVCLTHPAMGSEIIKTFTMKHPVALAKQKELFALRPKVFSMLMKIVMDPYHPYRELEEYKTVIALTEEYFPRTGANEEAIAYWETVIDGALFCFATCSCIQTALLAEELSAPLLITSDLIPILENQPTINVIRPDMMAGHNILYLNDVCVHGDIQPRQFKFLMEMGNAYKFFLSRKLAILKKLESDPDFCVGLFNVSVRVKKFPSVYISFILKQNPGITHINGVNFSDVIPMICVSPDCHENHGCSINPHAFTHIYIRVNSVQLEDPTMAANNTINFAAITQTLNGLNHGQYFDTPIPSPVEVVKHDITPCLGPNNEILLHKSWNESYLSSLAKQYFMINSADEKVMKHFMYPESEMVGYEDDNMRFDEDFFQTYQLFFPGLHLKL